MTKTLLLIWQYDVKAQADHVEDTPRLDMVALGRSRRKVLLQHELVHHALVGLHQRRPAKHSDECSMAIAQSQKRRTRNDHDGYQNGHSSAKRKT